MPEFVIDASVYAKWFNKGEEFEEEALRLRNDFISGRVELYAPSQIVFEVCNTIWKNRNISDTDASLLAKQVIVLRPEIFKLDSEETEEAMMLARLENASFYDTAYIVAAKKLAFTLITADDKQHEAAKRHVKCRHLREGYPS